MTRADWIALVSLLFGTGGFGTSLFFWRQRQAAVRKLNADARIGEINADKGEAEIRRLDTETAIAFRAEFNETVKEFREERRQMSAERQAEREQYKAERAAERAAHQEALQRKEEQFRAEVAKWTAKLDEAMVALEAERKAREADKLQSQAALEAERKAREADRIEFQAAIQRCADESQKGQEEVATIKGQLKGMKLQLELLVPLVEQMTIIEATLSRIEAGTTTPVPQSE